MVVETEFTSRRNINSDPHLRRIYFSNCHQEQTLPCNNPGPTSNNNNVNLEIIIQQENYVIYYELSNKAKITLRKQLN